MKKKFLPLAIFTIILSSCVTINPEPNKKTPDGAARAETTGVSGSGYEERRDLREIGDLPAWVYDSSPKDGHPRSVSFTPRYAHPENAMQTALGLAALDAARRDGIFVASTTLTQEGNHNFGHIKDLQIEFLTDNKAAYLDELELERFIYTPKGSVGRFLLPGHTLSPEISYTPDRDNPPEWITKAPRIDGYLVAVGTAERHQSWGYSFDASDKNAIASLVTSLYAKVTVITQRKQTVRNDNSQFYSLETLFVQGKGVLKDFMIIARWAAPDESQYYSLAVVPVTF